MRAVTTIATSAFAVRHVGERRGDHPRRCAMIDGLLFVFAEVCLSEDVHDPATDRVAMDRSILLFSRDWSDRRQWACCGWRT
jgi:hypothetical protein